MRRPSFRLVSLALIALALATCPRQARALDVDLGAPRENGGYVWLDLALADLFPPRVEESLGRGMPATLQLKVELWRHRSGWFDRLQNTYESRLKIRYDVWNDQYRLEREGVPTEAFASLDSLRAMLSHPLALPVTRVGMLDPGGRYYLSVSVTLKPLTVEDLEEGEGWLSGEVRDKKSSGLGIITALPRALFDTVRNFAGFGDQRSRATSPDFTLAELFGK